MERFPRGPLGWRLFYGTEARLGSLPMVVVAPTIASVGATAWALSHPAQTIRKGLIVGEQSFWHALLNGVLGGVVGLLAVVGLVFVGVWIWYRVLGGDAVWEADYASSHEGIMFIELRCKPGVVPADPGHLGTVECWLKTPKGAVVGPRTEPVRRHDPNGLVARVAVDPEPGRYEIRWSAAREGERLHEIARKKFSIGSPTGTEQTAI